MQSNSTIINLCINYAVVHPHIGTIKSLYRNMIMCWMDFMMNGQNSQLPEPTKKKSRVIFESDIA